MKKFMLLFMVLIVFLVSLSPALAQEPTPTPQCMTVDSGQVCYFSNTAVSITLTDTEIPTQTVIPPTQPDVTTIPLQTSIEFFRNPAFPGLSCTTGASWSFPGSAATASTHRFYADKMQGRQIDTAIWLVAWTPNSTTSSTGIRLIKFDNNTPNYEEIAKLEKTGISPISDGAYVTDALQAILDAGQFKQLGQQTRGNGSVGCIIYASWIDIVWK